MAGAAAEASQEAKKIGCPLDLCAVDSNHVPVKFGQPVDPQDSREWLWAVLRFHEKEVAKYRSIIQEIEEDKGLDDEDELYLAKFRKKVEIGEAVIADCKKYLGVEDLEWFKYRRKGRKTTPARTLYSETEFANRQIIEIYEDLAGDIEETQKAIDFLAQREAMNKVFLEQLANEVKYFSFQASNGLSDAIRQDAKEELALVKKFIGTTQAEQKLIAEFIEGLFKSIDELREFAPLN